MPVEGRARGPEAWKGSSAGGGGPGDGAAAGWGGAQSLQRRQPRPWLKSEHAEGGGVQFGGEAGALGAGGARRPGEPVKNVLAF